MRDGDTIHESGDSPHPAGVPKIGDVIAGKYTVQEVLGMGGMGVVVAARHNQLGEKVAIKVLLPRALRDKEAIGRFVREARTAARIKSEHVAHVHDIGTLESGTPYILMEYLEGRDLGAILREERRLPITEAVDYVLQACVAIAEAHALGIVHRDLKPSNLFLTARSDGTPLVKVVDFGISKALDADLDEPRDTQLTDTTAVFGSPAYMSPEQIRSAKNVDYRTDIWSLGVILFELLTGTGPFKAETASGLLAAIAADPPSSLRDAREEAPAELEEVIARCLTKDVSRRFATIGELAQALAPFALAESRIHVERIRRLTTAGSGRLPAPRRSMASVAPPAAFAATEKPWSTAPRERPRGRLTAIAIVVAGLLIGGVFAVRMKRHAPTPTVAPPSAVAASLQGSAPTALIPEPAPTAAASTAPATPPPIASASASARSATPPARPHSPPPRPQPPATSTQVAPPPTGTPTRVPDPTDESH